MDLHESHDTPSAASGLAQAQTACCGASNLVTHVRFDVRRDIHSTGGYDPEDEWSRDSSDGTVEVLAAYIVKDDGYKVLSIGRKLSVGDEIFLVWAQYSTGDSFGHDGGQYELLEVLTDREQAEARAEFYKSVNDYSVPWNGYFEDLDFVRVDAFTLGVQP